MPSVRASVVKITQPRQTENRDAAPDFFWLWRGVVVVAPTGEMDDKVETTENHHPTPDTIFGQQQSLQFNLAQATVTPLHFLFFSSPP